MGMSASQARLLTLTSRMHDVEFKAQNIESQKLQLATQRDDLYEDYCAKLDAKKIQVAVGYNGASRVYVDANFANIAEYSENRTVQYALRLSDTDKVVVPEDVYIAYQDFNSDKYSFAWAMMGLDNGFSWNLDDGSYGGREGMAVGIHADKRGYNAEGGDGDKSNLLMTDVEQLVYDNHDGDGVLEKYYNAFVEANAGDDVSEQDEALTNFRDYLYSTYGSEIYSYMILDKNDPENKDIEGGLVVRDYQDRDWSDVKNKFDYYVHLFEEINECGGCVSIIDVADGQSTDNDWFNMMVNTGQILIDVWADNKSGWTETSVATCTTNNYLQEVSDDTDLKKAEAEYEHELNIVNQKDKKFDQELNKLETERTAIKTEIDSIKQVKNDNIERTFGIFS